MKKLALISLTIILVLYTATWFTIANIAEKTIHTKIDELKANGTIKSYSGDIDITGYPFKFMVNLEYPNIHFTPKDHIGSYNLLYNGNVKIILGLFSNSVKLKTDGNMHLKGNINDYKFHIVSSGEETSFSIKLYDFLLSPKLITNFIKSSDSIKQLFFGVIKKVHFSSHNLKLINKTNDEMLFNVEDAYLTLSTKYNNKYRIGYEEKDINAEFGPDLNILWDNVSTIPKVKKALSQIPYNVRNYFNIFKLNELGIINYDAKINIIVDDNKDTELYVDRFLLKDDIENIDVSGKIKVFHNKTSVNINSKINFNEKWYHLMQRYIRSADFTNFNANFFKKSNKNSVVSAVALPINNFMNNLLTKKQSEIKASYIPKFHEMGDVITKVNAQYQREENKDFELEIDEFELNTKEFSVKTEGDFKNRDDIDIYKLEIDLTNYPTMIDITTNYLNRIAESANYNFLIAGKELTISQKTSTRIKNLIQTISSSPETSKKDARILAKKDKTDKYPEIGQYSPEEFHIIWRDFKSRLIMEKIESKVNDYLNNKIVKNKLTEDTAKNISSVIDSLFKNTF